MSLRGEKYQQCYITYAEHAVPESINWQLYLAVPDRDWRFQENLEVAQTRSKSLPINSV